MNSNQNDNGMLWAMPGLAVKNTIKHRCSSITIPKDLKQHPVSVVIIHSANIMGSRCNIPALSIR
jgi:hypothetical protein